MCTTSQMTWTNVSIMRQDGEGLNKSNYDVGRRKESCPAMFAVYSEWDLVLLSMILSAAS